MAAPVHPFATVLLGRLKFAVAQKIGAEFAESLTISLDAVDLLTGEMTYRLSGFVLAHTNVEARRTVIFEKPATWWQHAKLALRERDWKHTPPPLRNRLHYLHVVFTYEKVEVVFTEQELFPHADIVWPDRLGPVVIHQTLDEHRHGDTDWPWPL